MIVSRGASLDDYDRAFGFLMAICGVAAIVLVAYALVRDRAGPGRLAVACAFVALAPLALGSVMLTRFDLWPAALVAAALALLLAGRNRLALGVLGVADRGEDLPSRPAPDLRRPGFGGGAGDARR